MTHVSKFDSKGFTLVEISIVMIIIGLLIGGTFGGMKLIENMEVNKTAQDLKAIESAGLTFKDLYGRIPGDLLNTSARLPNCTVAPCATAGNGDRILDSGLADVAAIVDTNERFTFWSHLQAADLVSLGTKNTTDMSFGEGQPNCALGGGYRMTVSNSNWGIANSRSFSNTIVAVVGDVVSSAAILSSTQFPNTCQRMKSVDLKLDDGLVNNGYIKGYNCSATPGSATSDYNNGTGLLYFDTKGF